MPSAATRPAPPSTTAPPTLGGELGQLLGPVGGQLAVGDGLKLGPVLGVLLLVLGGQRVPGLVGGRAALRRLGKLGVRLLGHLQRREVGAGGGVVRVG